MVNFFDTSVFIGYTFCDDRWRQASEGMLCVNAKKLSSDKVQHEYEKKHKHLHESRRYGLIQLREKIANSVTGGGNTKHSLNEIEGLISQIKIDDQAMDWLKNTAKKLAIKSYNKIDLYNRIEKFLDSYFRFSTKRMDEVIKWFSLDVMAIECYGRYSQFGSILAEFKKNGMLNEDDNEIILDAHDICSLIEEPIDLVTGDYHDYKRHEAIIVSNTRIHSVIYLGDWRP